MAHLCPVTGKAVEEARGGCTEEVVGVDGEEIDAWHAVLRVADVSTEIDLRKVARAGNGWQATQADAVHPKGDDAEPGAALEGIELHAVWNERGECSGRQGPVR